MGRKSKKKVTQVQLTPSGTTGIPKTGRGEPVGTHKRNVAGRMRVTERDESKGKREKEKEAAEERRRLKRKREEEGRRREQREEERRQHDEELKTSIMEMVTGAMTAFSPGQVKAVKASLQSGTTDPSSLGVGEKPSVQDTPSPEDRHCQ